MLRILLTCYLIFSSQLTHGFTNSKDDWKILQARPLVLACHKQDIDTGREILGMVEENMNRIAQDLNLEQINQIQIILAPSENEFQRLTAGSIPDWGVGAANPLSRTIFLKSPRYARPETDTESVVIHELAHILLGMVLNGQPVDRWFDEGFALQQSGEASMESKIIFARSLILGNSIPLSNIDAVLTFQRDKAGLAYQESHSALRYLVQQYGIGIIPKIVEQIRLGESMDAALRNAAGLSLDEFEYHWLNAMKKRYRWYIIFDFPILFSVLLVVFFLTAWVLTKNRNKKRKRMWDEEETKKTLQEMAENPIRD